MKRRPKVKITDEDLVSDLATGVSGLPAVRSPASRPRLSRITTYFHGADASRAARRSTLGLHTFALQRHHAVKHSPTDGTFYVDRAVDRPGGHRQPRYDAITRKLHGDQLGDRAIVDPDSRSGHIISDTVSGDTVR